MAVTTIGGNVLAAGVIVRSLTPASVAANTTAEQTFTFPGVRVGDFVEVNAPGITAGVDLGNTRVSAADTVAIAFQNSTAGGLTPPAGNYVCFVVRPEASASSFAP
ncbi:MAG: hypothetical protein ING29_11350 [Azospirillum sp.]|nr:hypothetical protein [Azospirillum sp.]